MESNSEISELLAKCLSKIQNVVVIRNVVVVLGHVFDIIAYQFYLEFVYRLRHKKKVSEKQLHYLKERFPSLDIQFEPKDWSVMFTFLRERNADIARIIDKYQADSIMLRNIAFGLLLLAIVYVGMFFSTGVWALLPMALGAFLVSLLSIGKSNKFRAWSYTAIFEASLGYGRSLREVAEYTRRDLPSIPKSRREPK